MASMPGRPPAAVGKDFPAPALARLRSLGVYGHYNTLNSEVGTRLADEIRPVDGRGVDGNLVRTGM